MPPDHFYRPIALDNLGTVLTLVGKYDEAGELLQRALTITERAARGGTPIVLESLAELEQARGRHTASETYRDLKPANILIPTAKAGSSIPDAVPEVKILDFGLARMTDTDVQMTTFHTDMGRIQRTLPYMSPEQIRGNPDEIDPRTDATRWA